MYMCMHVESVLSMREVVFFLSMNVHSALLSWSIVHGMSRRGSLFSNCQRKLLQGCGRVEYAFGLLICWELSSVTPWESRCVIAPFDIKRQVHPHDLIRQSLTEDVKAHAPLPYLTLYLRSFVKWSLILCTCTDLVWWSGARMHVSVCVAPFMLAGSYYKFTCGTELVMDYITTYGTYVICMTL